MGIDFSLSNDHPSVIINGKNYYYGHVRSSDKYLVENANYAKDYWSFKEKEDLVAFLINLPESADNKGRISVAYPDWHDVTHEQRSAYLEEDRASQRLLAQEKIRAGTARSFNMDLEGAHGPYEPQRLESRSDEPPLQRVERQLSDFKASHPPPKRDSSFPAGRIGDLLRGLMDHSWESGLTDAGKLRVLEGELDWTDVSDRDKEAVLAREVDFTKITREQFDYVYFDIEHDRCSCADESAARRLFDKAAELRTARTADEPPPGPRDTTRNLVESIWLDVWPRSGAIVDFGLKSQEHYEALYYPVREGEITAEALDAALGKGEKLTALARSARSNPHRDIEFRTDWDFLRPEPDHDADGRPETMSSPVAGGQESGKRERLSSPGEIADGGNGPEPPEPGRGRDRGNGR
jgi:hypothetical protein